MKTELYTSELLDNLMSEITPEEQSKTDKKMQLAALIADGIKDKGLNKTEFATAVGKQPSVITKWLSGTHNFSTDTLFDIEQVLGIELFNLSNKPKEQVIKYELSVTAKVNNDKDSIYGIYNSELPTSFYKYQA